MGFFNLATEVPTVRGDEKISKTPTRNMVYSCADCGLEKGCKTPHLRFTGDGEKRILIVGERPSYDEDDAGKLGFGTEYRFIKEALEEIGIDIKKDCYYTTTINCAPSKDRTPTYLEISACRPRLLKLIERLNPTTVILVGEAAFASLIEPRLSGRIAGMTAQAFMGEHIPDQQYKVWLTPIWAVSSLLERRKYDDGNSSKPRYERDIAYFNMWKRHLADACALSAPPTIADYRDQCFIAETEEKSIEIIKSAMSWKYMAFDYETTGRKPHRKGHRIWTVSISDGFVSWAFKFYDSPAFLSAWRELMLSDVKKIGQNIAYEMLWTFVRCGYWPNNWYWDTMLGQHCLANQKPTGLKFMVYASFGHPGYDDEVDEYLKATKTEEDLHGANAINQIHRAPIDKLLLYDALDSLYTFKIMERQRARFSKFQLQGFELFMESTQTLTMAQSNGFNIDMMKHQEVSDELETLMVKQYDMVMNNEVLMQWTDGKFNFGSSQQLGRLFYDILKIKPPAYTDSGKPSVNEEALEKINVPIAKDILAYRKLAKLKDTYIAQYAVEAVDGKIYPYFNLNGVDTYRSSSSAPNIQNQPKRDKNAKKMLRQFITPSRGNRIVELDYKSLEVAINCVYSKDPTMIKYLTDPTTDMHRDSAADCFLLKPEEVPKALRGDVKGAFVFAEFYGSYYKQVSKDLWEIGERHNLRQHLADRGVKTFADFERHIQEAERILWEERFPVHNEWRESQWKFYQKHGYVELKSGFRCYGPMKRNNTFNTPVQGSGFHVLLWTMNQVNKKVQKLERSKIIGEIHDSCIMDVHDSEADLVDYWYWLYGTQKVREHFDWICVPLTVEKEQSEIDGSWADMKEVGPLKGD